jgi:hypothetical protein
MALYRPSYGGGGEGWCGLRPGSDCPRHRCVDWLVRSSGTLGAVGVPCARPMLYFSLSHTVCCAALVLRMVWLLQLLLLRLLGFCQGHRRSLPRHAGSHV